MLNFAIRRAIWLIPTLLVMAAITYLLMELTPGSPFDLEGANGITPEMIANLEKLYGLDKPWYERYAIYVGNALQGDFGVSYSYRPQQVSDIIQRTLPVSLHLGLMATLFAIVARGAAPSATVGKIQSRGEDQPAGLRPRSIPWLGSQTAKSRMSTKPITKFGML